MASTGGRLEDSFVWMMRIIITRISSRIFLGYVHFSCNLPRLCLVHASLLSALCPALCSEVTLEGCTSCPARRCEGIQWELTAYPASGRCLAALGSPGKDVWPQGFCFQREINKTGTSHVMEQCAWDGGSEVVSFPCSEAFDG